MFFRKALSSIGAVSLLLALGSVVRADYEDEVLSDDPVAYWRLDDEDDLSLLAVNSGSAGAAIDGRYVGGVFLENDSLLRTAPDNPSILLEGVDGQVNIPDSNSINTGGPFHAATIELWFQADVIDTQPRMLWEQGGTTRGLSMYVQEVDGEPLLVMAGWNLAEEQWGVLSVSIDIDPEIVHHAVMVFEATENATFGDFDGRITGYLDGEEFDTVLGADQLYAHSNDNAIGGIAGGQTLLADGTNPPSAFFSGAIDEVALYSYPLDDPDDDGDFSDSRVLDHYQAGHPPPGCPGKLTVAPDAMNVKLAWTKGAETSVRVVRDGTEVAAAAPVDPPEYVDVDPPPGVLSYELYFTGPGLECPPRQEKIDTCISGLTLTEAGGQIQLEWQNGLLYSNIVVMRGDEVIATLGGSETSYTDANPPIGFWTYTVAPADGDCTAASAMTCILGPGYSQMVVDDGAGAYWRLGERIGTVAGNCGSQGLSLNGTYSGNVELGQESLVATVDDPSVLFDGIDGEVLIPDSDYINLGGPWGTRSVELWFQADLIDVVPGMLYEQGGGTRGLSMLVQEVDGEDLIFMSVWNRDDAQGYFDPVIVTAPVVEGVTYHAVMVFDASENDVFGDFDGRVTGYLNGQEFDSQTGADRLFEHTGNISIGSVDNDTRLPDLTTLAEGAYFSGVIDEVAVYDLLLDDPNDDGDRGDSRVLEHFVTGSGVENCPTALTAERDGGNIKLAWTPGIGETSVRITRNGTELAAAAPVDPPEYVDTTAEVDELVYELTFNSPGCPALTKRFDACITNLTARASQVEVELAWENNFDYTGIVIQRGSEILATIAGDQVSYTDTDPPTGDLTYSVVPENGSCDPATVDVSVFDTLYPNLVVNDDAVAYWRLDDEDAVALVAVNRGSAGTALDGTYVGSVLLENDSLLPAVPDNPSVLFEGIDGWVDIPDSSFTNTVGPFPKKTIELWFEADIIDTEPRILFEQGGTTRGLSVYVHEDNGTPTVFMCGWNLGADEENWGPLCVSAEIEPGATYHAVMVYEATENEELGDYDGRITGYLDGEEFDTALGADLLYAHSNDTAIGAVAGDETKLADGTNKTSDGFFSGAIDEVSLYNIALDDPDGDKDLSDSRVMDHYLAGSEGGGPGRPVFHRGDADGDGTITLTDAVSTLSFLFSGGEDTTCKETQDFNNDAGVDLTDAVGVLLFLFSGGDAPAAPGPTSEPCGPDPDAPGSAGDLGCESYNGC